MVSHACCVLISVRGERGLIHRMFLVLLISKRGEKSNVPMVWFGVSGGLD